MKEENILGFVPAIIDYCNSKFPHECSNCKKVYPTFKQFIEETKAIGHGPMSYVLDSAFDPIRLISYVDCDCGNTMALRCDEAMAGSQQLFTQMLSQQSQRENRSPESILTELRERVRQTLAVS